VRELAEGGMGVVYEAIDERLEQRCALKCAKPGFQRRLSPEARAALRVTHDNVCRVYEIHTTQTDHGPVDFLSMEYVEGETLAARVQRQGRLDADEAQLILQQLCLGLSAAHRGGLLHRDLKSNNVMLTKSPGDQVRAVIMDFGLARESLPGPEAALRFSSNLRGAPAYIAPELWQGAKASVASDIYSLGAITYEMVTGRKPFPSDASIEQRLSQLPPAPSTVVPKLGSVWNKVILKCLNPDPARRFSSVEEILEQLHPHKLSLRRSWPWAAAVAIVSVVLYLTRPGAQDTSEPARLAVLPAQITACNPAEVSGILYDVSDRVRTLPHSNLVLIPLSAALKNDVSDPKAAGARLSATHALQTSLRCAGDKVYATAAVFYSQSMVKVQYL